MTDETTLEAYLPPQNLDAERSVLGACMIDASASRRAFRLLVPASFYAERHRHVARAMQALCERGEPVDVITLSDELEAAGHFAEAGGTDALLELMDVVPTAANVEHYAKIVRRCEVARQAIGIHRTAIEAIGRGEDLDEIGSFAIRSLQSLRSEAAGELVARVSTLLPGVVGGGQAESAPSALAGLRCGIDGLDAVLEQVKRTYLVVLSGRPGEGKTTLMLAIARGVAQHTGPVMAWSGECPRDVLAERLLACESTERGRHIRAGTADRALLHGAISRLGDLPLWLVSDALLPTVENLEAAALVVAEEERRPVALLCLDRIELMAGIDHPDENTRVHRRAVAVKGLTRRLDTVALLVGQPNENRLRERRTTPTPGDLQYGGGLRQCAQLILFIHRDECDPADVRAERAPGETTSRLWVVKNNDGRSEYPIPLHFQPELPGWYASPHDYLLRRERAPRPPAEMPAIREYATDEIPF